MSWKTVPQFWAYSSETSVSIAAVLIITIIRQEPKDIGKMDGRNES